MAQGRYIYGSAAPKRDYYEHSRTERAGRHERGLEVIPGGRKRESASASYDFAMKAARITLVALIAFALISFVRISLSTATVAEAVQASEIKGELSEIKSQISSMQAQRSSLSNPVRIKKDAVVLGMVSPEQTQVIKLEKDIVVVDEEGSLSLEGSLESLG